MSKGDRIDAVAFGLTMELPPDVVAKHAKTKWTAAKYKGEEVDGAGQRWAVVAMPIGDKVQKGRSDLVIAVALIKGPDGYSTARLEIPMSVADQYAVESTLPDPHRASVLEKAAGMLDEAVA